MLIFLLLQLSGDWMPPGVQSKFHTWSRPGNQLENPSSIFTSRLHSISSSYYPPLTHISSFHSHFFFILRLISPPFPACSSSWFISIHTWPSADLLMWIPAHYSLSLMYICICSLICYATVFYHALIFLSAIKYTQKLTLILIILSLFITFCCSISYIFRYFHLFVST